MASALSLTQFASVQRLLDGQPTEYIPKFTRYDDANVPTLRLALLISAELQVGFVRQRVIPHNRTPLFKIHPD
jgi:hypothetical protein